MPESKDSHVKNIGTSEARSEQDDGTPKTAALKDVLNVAGTELQQRIKENKHHLAKFKDKRVIAGCAAALMLGTFFFLLLLYAILGSGGISMESYEKIRPGMSQAQVKSILGSNGKSIQETAGMAGGHSIYVWSRRDGATITVFFSAGYVTAKTQQGL